jgi:predicted hotdog family 3-hydroxylacyl-ACP dehydratase
LPISELIPHQGAMCLWQEIVACDEDSICCRTRTHLLSDHPLKVFGALSLSALVEYGAQAIAVHGGVLAYQQAAAATPQAGFIASVRGVKFDRWNPSTAFLTVKARVLLADEASKHYAFSLYDADANQICSGRIMVVHPQQEGV